MAVLPDAERVSAWNEFMSWWSDGPGPATLNKIELRAAVDAVDNWVDANSTSFNSALPVAARTRLTAQQKAKLLLLVVARRFGVL